MLLLQTKWVCIDAIEIRDLKRKECFVGNRELIKLMVSEDYSLNDVTWWLKGI